MAGLVIVRVMTVRRMTMSRSAEQRLSDAQEGRWYAPTPFEQIHECGARVNPDAVRLALEDVLGKREKKGKQAA